MTQQTEALRLAECLERDCEMNWPDYDNQMAAAAELRRMEAVIQQLMEALDFVNNLDVLGSDDRTKALVLDAVLWKVRAAIKAAKGEA
jgi:hypothetical protein